MDGKTDRRMDGMTKRQAASNNVGRLADALKNSERGGEEERRRGGEEERRRERETNKSTN